VVGLIRSLLYQAEPLDTETVGAILVLLVLFGFLAAVGPAWQTARIKPAAALRG
jgi:ABC-type lipoprotein release transport system permease subunit